MKAYDNDLFEAFASASNNTYIYATDMTTGRSRWSENSVEYFDLPDEYLDDVEEVWIPKIHPEDRNRYTEDITNVFSGVTDHHQCEYRVMNRHGSYVWVECRGTMVRDEAGKAKVFAGMMTRLDAMNKYDPLTHLKSIYSFNLLDFTEGRGSIVLIGFDRFREVINKYGYTFGDRILYQFARRLDEYCGSEYEAYRLEGDEFLIVTPLCDRECVQNVFDEICSLIKGLGTEDEQPQLSISGGAVSYPADNVSRETMISNLEYTLKYAKAHCRGKLAFFADDVIRRRARELHLSQELINCIANDFAGFELYYQPVVDAATEKIEGCEALLRWTSPESGPVSIAEVIPALEENGKIIDVGYWIFEEAMKTAEMMQAKKPDFIIGVNVSYVQFKEESFTDKIIQIVKKYKVNPERVCLELTESYHVDDFTQLNETFQKLRDFGFKISLDDFGTAYSTMLNLRNLPTDHVKIDHSFVRNLTKDNFLDQAIVESIITLCKRLDMKVVIEGVENQEVLDIVKQYPADYYQGYHFAKPMPLKELTALINEQV